MSERQAKLKRKNESQEVQHHHRKRSKGEIITNVVIGVAIAACLGLGGWAIADKHQSKAQQTAAQDQAADTSAQDTASQQQVPTIEEYAQSLGMTGEDFIKEYGLDKSGEEISPSMEMTLATEYMTLGNYAKLQGQDVETVKQSMGLENSDYNEDTMMSEVLANMQAAQAAADGQETTENDAQNEQTDAPAEENTAE